MPATALALRPAPLAPATHRRNACNGPRSWTDLPPGHVVRRMHCGAFEVLGLPDVSPEFPTRRAAEGWLATRLQALPARLRPRHRPCLCCTTPILSDGPHHRLCDGCRGLA